MTGRRRRSSLLPWVGLSLLLLLVPAAFSQKIRLSLLAAFRPLKALAGFSTGARTEEVDAQIRYYKDKLQQLQIELAAKQQQLDLATHQKEALKDLTLTTIPADVLLPTDGSPWRKSLTLALGTRGGARKGMLVLHHNQFVGRIQETGPWTSRVQLCTDPGFRAGAVAVPRQYTQGVSFEKRHVGVYEGTAGENGHLKWLTGDTPIDADALVLTTEDPLSGIPRGLILGRVSKLSAGRGAFPRVEVEPTVNFRALEQVLLLVPAETPP